MNKQNLIDLFKRHLTAYQSIASCDDDVSISHDVADNLSSIQKLVAFIHNARFLSEVFIPKIIEQLEKSHVDNEIMVNNIQKYRQYYLYNIIHYSRINLFVSSNSFLLLEDLPLDAERIAQEPLLAEPVGVIADQFNEVEHLEALDICALMMASGTTKDSQFYFNGNIDEFDLEQSLSSDLNSLENVSKNKHATVYYDASHQRQEPTNEVMVPATASTSDRKINKDASITTLKNSTAMQRALENSLREDDEDKKKAPKFCPKRTKKEANTPDATTKRTIIHNPCYATSAIWSSPKALPTMTAEPKSNPQTTALGPSLVLRPSPVLSRSAVTSTYHFFSSADSSLRASPLLSGSTTESDSLFSLHSERDYFERIKKSRPLFSSEERQLEGIKKQLEMKESTSLIPPQ